LVPTRPATILGITEDDIVRSANSLANKVKAPEYARTYPEEVKLAPRVKEMMALARATGAMNVTDLIRMGHELLDDLQIDR